MKKDKESMTITTEAEALKAVQKSGLALDFVPEVLKTEAVCMTAVVQDYWAMQYVPDAAKTPKLCEVAVKMYGGMLGSVPVEFRTLELCRKATRQSGLALESVPPALRTPEICLNAVRISGTVLACVPDDLKTPEICLAAVKSDGTALEYVPERLKSMKICRAAIGEAGELAYDHLPRWYVRLIRTGSTIEAYEELQDKSFRAFWAAYGSGDEAERVSAFDAFSGIPMSPEVAGEIVRQALQNGGTGAVSPSAWLRDSYMAGKFDTPELREDFRPDRYEWIKCNRFRGFIPAELRTEK